MNAYVSRAIYTMRLPLIIGPLLIHACMCQDFNLQYLLKVAGLCSVTVFYVISGYLFWNGYNNTFESYVLKIRSRIKSLLVPYLLWNIIAYIVFVSIGNLQVSQWKEIFWVISTDPGHGPADYVLWFVRTLLMVIPFAPVYYIINKNKYLKWISVIALLLWFFELPGIFSRGTVQGFVLFNFGSFLRLNNVFEQKHMCPSRKTGILFSLLWLVFVILWWYVSLTDDSIVLYISKTCIVLSALFYYSLPVVLSEKCTDRLIGLSSSSFFFFCFFPILLEPLKLLLTSCFGDTDLTFVLMVIIVTIVSIYLFKGLKKFIPSVTSVLTGSR